MRKEIIRDRKFQLWVLYAVAALAIVSLGFTIGFYVPSKPLGESQYQECEKIANTFFSNQGTAEIPSGYSMTQISEYQICVAKDGYAGGVNATLIGKFTLANRDSGIAQRIANGMYGIIISIIVAYVGFLVNPWTYKILLT